MNEWIKGILIMSYKFLHQQNNPIGKLDVLGIYIYEGLDFQLLYNFLNHLCSTWSFLIFLNKSVKNT